MATNKRQGFYETLSEAIADLAEHGYDNHERVVYWMDRLRAVANWVLLPLHVFEEKMRAMLIGIYRSKIERGGILKFHSGISRFTLDRVAPRLRSALDRSIAASADLIKLNRSAAIDKTLLRFSGWATSIPIGGSDAIDRIETKSSIRSELTKLKFIDRRVQIDQGHKFVGNLSRILATDGGAIAAVWHSNWRQLHYNYREDHKERDLRIYMVRGNWAQEKGLVKVGEAGYLDAITQPGEEVYCRCHAQYIYTLGKLPDEMITNKGREEIARALALREAI